MRERANGKREGERERERERVVAALKRGACQITKQKAKETESEIDAGCRAEPCFCSPRFRIHLLNEDPYHGVRSEMQIRRRISFK